MNFTFYNYFPMTIYQERLRELEERTIAFSVAVIGFCAQIKKSSSLQSVSLQLIRSSTSIGANYAEANNASSRADFRNKIYIAKKEAAETRYWLDIISRISPNLDTSKLRQESLEFVLIFQKILSTMKARSTNDK